MALSAITQAAVDAAKAEQQTRASAARTVLAAFLEGKVPAAALSVLEVSPDLVVVTDGTVSLAVRGDDVLLVRGRPGDWTDIAGPLEGLVELGQALA